MSDTLHLQPVNDSLVDQHLDLVLRASGSGLRHYNMEMTRKNMREAMRSAMAAGGASHAMTPDSSMAASVLMGLHEEIASLADWRDEDGISVVAKERVLNIIQNRLLLATVEPEAERVEDGECS